MARINIEDSLFKDSRFLDLCIFYQDKQKALGVLVWAFMVAQKHYLEEESDRLIPLSEWKRQSCDDKLIELGFAEVKEKGIYVSGSEKQFAWLIQRVEAGRKGGLGGRHMYSNMTNEQRAQREKARKAVANAIQRGRLVKPQVCSGCGTPCLPEAHHSDYSKPFEITWVCKKCHHEIHDKLLGVKDDGATIATVKRDKAEAKPLNSYLLSPSSNSLLTTHTHSKNFKNSKFSEIFEDEKITADKSGGVQVWEFYCTAFKTRYGVEPIRNAKVNSQCKQLHQRLGRDSEAVINFYMAHNDAWFLKNQHDLGSLLAKAESLHTQWQRGQAVTSIQVREAERVIQKNELRENLHNLFTEENNS